MFKVILLLMLVRCTTEDPDLQPANCDCQTSPVSEEEKDVEVVVVLISGNNAPGGNQGPDIYVLSTEPKDFEATTYHVGKNILVPCSFLPVGYQKAGSRLVVSYKRKECYGAISLPELRSNFGYHVDLTSIAFKL